MTEKKSHCQASKKKISNKVLEQTYKFSDGWLCCADSSTEQPPTGDSSGVDLPTFLAETVNRNQKDRTLLLRIENDLMTLVKDPK